MESCLAATGSNLSMVLISAVAMLFVGALLILFRKKITRFSFLGMFIGTVMVSGAIATPATYAAEDCSAATARPVDDRREDAYVAEHQYSGK